MRPTPTKATMRAYYQNNYRIPGANHKPDQRVIPPANVERREFSGPCFCCESRGPCRHRRTLFPESNPESFAA